eukprot:m51a1_g9252 hypothetical protein (1195) ;mRNA; r:21772-26772
MEDDETVPLTAASYAATSVSTAGSLQQDALRRFAAADLDGDVLARDETNTKHSQVTNIQCDRGHNLTKATGKSGKQEQCDMCFNVIAPGAQYVVCKNCLSVLCSNCCDEKLNLELRPVLQRMTKRLDHLCSSGNLRCPEMHRMVPLVHREDPEERCTRCQRRVAPPGAKCPDCAAYVRCVRCLFEEQEEAVRSGAAAADYPKPSGEIVRRYQGIKCNRHKRKAMVTTLGNRQHLGIECILCGENVGDCAGEGKVVVMCPMSRCKVVLCNICADFVVRQRLLAQKHNPSTLPACSVDLSLEVGRYPFRCNMCEQYYTPDETEGMEKVPLVWLSDHKTVFSMCLPCAARGALEPPSQELPPPPTESQLASLGASKNSSSTSIAMKSMKESTSELIFQSMQQGFHTASQPALLLLQTLRKKKTKEEFKKWEDFALKQERKFERGLHTVSIIDTPLLKKSKEAWQELEEAVHLSQEMPVPIVYEIEVAISAHEESQGLDPFLRLLIQNCKWPIHTTLRLIKLANTYARKYVQTEAIWLAQAEYLQELSLQMLEKFDKPEHVRNLVINPRPHGHIPKPLISLALEADHKKFLAHRYMHAVVLEKWHSPLRTEEGFSSSTFIITKMLLMIVTLVIRLTNKLSFGMLERSLATIQDRHAHPIVAIILVENDKSMLHLLDYFTVSPKLAYRLMFLSYCVFLVLVSVECGLSSKREFTTLEGWIAVWIVGLTMVELAQLWKRHLDYFESVWNYFDIVHLITYIGAYGVKIAANFMIAGSDELDYLLETYDCMLSIAIVLSYCRCLYMLLPIRAFGPFLVSFGGMMKNVAMFLIFAVMVIFAFSFALTKVFNPTDVEHDNPDSADVRFEYGSSMWRLILFIKILKTFGFGINNMPTLDPKDFTAGRYVVGVLFILLFMIVTTIVLINLLIAIMNDTCNDVESELESLDKATFAGVVEEFGESSPIPPPLNIVAIPIPPVINVFAWALRQVGVMSRCCCCTGIHCGCGALFHEVSPWSKPAPGHFCYNVYMHTEFFMKAKRLNRALLAEAAAEKKLSPWLKTLGAEDPNTLDEQQQQPQYGQQAYGQQPAYGQAPYGQPAQGGMPQYGQPAYPPQQQQQPQGYPYGQPMPQQQQQPLYPGQRPQPQMPVQQQQPYGGAPAPYQPGPYPGAYAPYGGAPAPGPYAPQPYGGYPQAGPYGGPQPYYR